MRMAIILALLTTLGGGRTFSQEPQAGAVVNIPLDAISLEKARELDGRKVVASLLIAKPSFTFNGKTVVGGSDHFDGIERGIVMDGERYDLDEGKRITVTGRIYVIDHPPALVGIVFVPACTEIRVVETKEQARNNFPESA